MHAQVVYAKPCATKRLISRERNEVCALGTHVSSRGKILRIRPSVHQPADFCWKTRPACWALAKSPTGPLGRMLLFGGPLCKKMKGFSSLFFRSVRGRYCSSPRHWYFSASGSGDTTHTERKMLKQGELKCRCR